MAPKESKLHVYKPEELSSLNLRGLSQDKFQATPFDWQIEAANGILCGHEVILDVGTGCGKTLVFQLPLLVDPSSVNLIISPLSALMIEQVLSTKKTQKLAVIVPFQAETSKLSTVAVCTETIEAVGRDALFKDIVGLKFQQVLVSPEISVSKEFSQEVLSKPQFTSHLRAVCIDEAHCINVWGGDFRPDYAALGTLRGRLPRNVPFLVASATLPDHVLDDIRATLELRGNLVRVAVTNDRPNVALSVRTMKYSDESKGDLRFLLHEGAESMKDIMITAVYCNERLATEDGCDALRYWARAEGIEDWEKGIVYYHAKLSTERKRTIEESLKQGKGCDMRNIERVVMWGVPSTFCALAQRAGRAARNMSKDGEAILVVSKATAAKDANALEADIEGTAVDALEPDVMVGEGNQLVSLQEGGARVSKDISQPKKPAKRAKTKQNYNSREAKYLVHFVQGVVCRRKVWNEFFRNETKRQLVYPTNTLFQPRPSLRCCDVCTPEKFPVEEIELTKAKGLTRGRKKQLPEQLQKDLRKRLVDWRDDAEEGGLFGMFYGAAAASISSISGNSLLGDDVIDKIVNSGAYIRTEEDLRRNVRWGLAFHDESNSLTKYGTALLAELEKVYKKAEGISPNTFYGKPKPKPRPITRPISPTPSPTHSRTPSPALPPDAANDAPPPTGVRRSARQAARASTSQNV
ncbi:hypothetical protein D9611_005316 [Ephemerocybe angulata]|uniref:Helicase ATP-binding domain-containing protein n=1 Tax=Ephemerocybe angulata TaxID=980116 RepID=A0A8H5C0R1_9AGAR|nr:hypothetical protein D9611_005316 [Tulosesus angulatus]